MPPELEDHMLGLLAEYRRGDRTFHRVHRALTLNEWRQLCWHWDRRAPVSAPHAGIERRTH